MRKNTIKNYMDTLTGKVILLKEDKRILMYYGKNISITVHYIASGVYTIYGYIREKVFDYVNIQGVNEVKKVLNNLYWNM